MIWVFFYIFKDVFSKVFNFIKSKIFSILLSLIFYFLLLLPFKVILPLLGLNYLFPIFSGFFACILIVASCLFENSQKLFSFIQLLYTFIIACTLGYFSYAFTQFEFLHLFFAFLPVLVECGVSENFVFSPSRLSLFMEGNDSPSPPSNFPLPEDSSSSATSSSASPEPQPQSSSSASSFEQEL
jgi:hypothetical protein